MSAFNITFQKQTNKKSKSKWVYILYRPIVRVQWKKQIALKNIFSLRLNHKLWPFALWLTIIMFVDDKQNEVIYLALSHSKQLQRQCIVLPQPFRKTAAHGLRYVTKICDNILLHSANLWRQHEISVASAALFAGFINSSGGYISKVPTNTVEKHVLWHQSMLLIGNLGLQECRMHLRSESLLHYS